MAGWMDFAEGFVTGLTKAADNFRGGHLQHDVCAMAMIERFCHQLRWPVSEKDSQSFILLFHDSVVQTRRVVVVPYRASVLIGAMSATSIRSEQVPVQVMGYLLTRTSELSDAAWQASVMENGSVRFCVRNHACLNGLDASLFGKMCETLVNEARAFDAKMNAAGLL